MANKGTFTITSNNWTNLTSLASISDRCDIQIINGSCLICDKTTTPSNEGFYMNSGDKFIYIPDTNLWIKPNNSKNICSVNINQ